MYCCHKSLLNRAKRALATINTHDVLFELVNHQNKPLNLDTLALAHRMGSVYINELLMETGKYLGSGIASLYNIFDPDTVIISGYGADFDSFILGIAQAEARSRIVNTFRREMRFEHARLKKEEGYKAISAYVLNDKLEELASR